jgi:FtsP/CotA-like multicopper oxidase with cupredoxin domain
MRRGLLLIVPLILAGSALAAPSPAGFFQPQEIVSHNGLFKATLTFAPGTAMVNGKPVKNMMTVNGMYPGPTLKMQPGDHVEITLINKLPDPTNFHFHGFRVTPSNLGDNVLRMMAPAVTTKELQSGNKYKISFTIPKDHQQGLYWYHPHMHEYVDLEVYSGIMGMIEVGDPLHDLPTVKGVTERDMALTAIQVTPGGKLNMNPATGGEMNLVNGRLSPTLHIRPGETQLWRVANISDGNWYKLQLPGHVLHVIGYDGNPVPYRADRNWVLLAPGNRAEILIQGGKPGVYKLRSLNFNEGFDKFGQITLATVVVSGTPETPRVLPTLISPTELREQQDTQGDDLVDRHTLTFSIDNPFPKNNFGFRINGKLFGPNRVDITSFINTTEEWTLRNTSFEYHPFHIHTNDFLVEKVNGKPVPIDGFHDTVPIPPHGSVVIRMRFRTFTGKAVFHCHILYHEDHGMMGIIQFKKKQ